MKQETDERMKMEIYRNMYLHHNFSENFMMFPISAKRMIVEIDPFYKFREAYKNYYKMPDLETLTMMPNENLFAPNTNQYVYEQQDQKLNIILMINTYIRFNS